MIFHINERITLKLKGKKTIIYIDKKEINYCKYLLLIALEKQKETFYFNSVDEIKEWYDNRLDGQEITPKDIGLTPEQEFWGHRSNIQAWVENNYDTRLLHSNLAFSLLKELSKNGSSQIINTFKEEIASKFLSSHLPTIIYLIKEEFLTNFTDEELEVLIYNLDFHKIQKFPNKMIQEFLGCLLIYIYDKPYNNSTLQNIQNLLKENLINQYDSVIENFVKIKELLRSIPI